MPDLYLSELRRLRNGALIYGLGTLLAMSLIGQVMELPTANLGAHLVLVLLAMLSGLGLAVCQLGSYRQASRWIWLLHRPLHPGRILAAIGLASSTVIALALVLPLFVVLLGQDRFTAHMIDQRQYAGVAFLGLCALSAWLAGAYIVLHRSRWAFMVLVLPILLTMHVGTWPVMIALSLVCNALLAGLVATVFRPDRIAPHEPLTTAASALPLQLGFYLALLWGGSTLFQTGLIVAGANPQMPGHVRPGGAIEAQRATPRDAILAGLGTAGDARAPVWRATLATDNAARVGPWMHGFAVRGLMTNMGTVHFSDGQEGAWTFSHDRMLYKGINGRTLAPLGWYGAAGRGDSTPFDSQPAALRDKYGHGYLMTAHDIYALEAGGTRLRYLLHVDGGERLAGVQSQGRHTAVLTNRRLLVFGPGATPALQAVLPLPLPFNALVRVDMAQVQDGLLVSFTGSRQLTYLVDPAGQAHAVAQRTLAHDFPPLFEDRDWWLSPPLHALANLPDMLIDEGVVPDYGASRFEPLVRARPFEAWVAAIVLALLAGLGAAWWTRGARMRPRTRLAWCLACLLLGVPALLSLMVLRPRPRDARAPARGLTPAQVPAPAPAGR